MRTVWMFAAVIATMGCAEKEEGVSALFSAGADDEEIYDAIVADLDGFESWGQVSPWLGVQYQSVGSPHGPYVQIWANNTAIEGWDALAEGGELPYGSTLVKRLYEDESEASERTDMLFVMRKVEGYDPENGDWFWVMQAVDESGEPTANYGAIEMCGGCHSVGGDYSRAFDTTPSVPSQE